MKRRSGGFTLMELMVVLSIAAAIIVVLGAPSFTAFRMNNRLTNSANDLLGSIVQARTEAIKRQLSVSWCRTASPNSSTASCSDAATAGWMIFVDDNRNCVRESGEVLIGGRALDHSMTLHPLSFKSNGTCISYAPTGFLQDVSGKVTATHTLFCDERGTAAISGTSLSAGRGVILARTGRAKISRSITGGLSDDLTTWGAAPTSLSCP
jgi:type IV fimbrial biogenesis protein FimT